VGTFSKARLILASGPHLGQTAPTLADQYGFWGWQN